MRFKSHCNVILWLLNLNMYDLWRLCYKRRGIFTCRVGPYKILDLNNIYQENLIILHQQLGFILRLLLKFGLTVQLDWYKYLSIYYCGNTCVYLQWETHTFIHKKTFDISKDYLNLELLKLVRPNQNLSCVVKVETPILGLISPT